MSTTGSNYYDTNPVSIPMKLWIFYMHDEIKDLQRRFIDCVEVLLYVCEIQSFARLFPYIIWSVQM